MLCWLQTELGADIEKRERVQEAETNGEWR